MTKKAEGFEGLDLATLENLARRGQLVVINEQDGKFKSVTVGVAIDAPLEKVWKAITAYEEYPKFMPQTESVSAKWEKNTAIVDFVIAIKVAVFKIKVKYTCRHLHQEMERIDFKAVKGDMKTVEGSWQFFKLGPKATLVLYTVFSDLKSIGRTVKFALDQEPSLEMGINTTSAVMVAASVKQYLECR